MRERKLKKMFNSIYVHEQFEYDGFVVLPFLNPAKVTEFLQLKNIAVAENNNRAEAILKPALDEIFFESRLFYGGLSDAKPAIDIKFLSGSTFTDETRFAAAFAYSPLTEEAEFSVIKGSHVFFKDLRAYPSNFSTVYADAFDAIPSHLLTVKVKPGEFFVYHPALIQAAPKTNGSFIEVGVAPNEADLYFYKKETEGQLQKYRLAETPFELKEKQFVPQALESMGTVNIIQGKVSKEDFLQKASPVVVKTWREKVSEKLIAWLS